MRVIMAVFMNESIVVIIALGLLAGGATIVIDSLVVRKIRGLDNERPKDRRSG